MAIYKGSTKLKELYVGNVKIKEAYVGSTCVYRAAYDEYILDVEWQTSNKDDNLTFSQLTVDGTRATLLSGKMTNTYGQVTNISSSDLLRITGATSGGQSFYTHIIELVLDLNYTPQQVVWRTKVDYAASGTIVGTFYGVKNSQRFVLGTIEGTQSANKTFTITL